MSSTATKPADNISFLLTWLAALQGKYFQQDDLFLNYLTKEEDTNILSLKLNHTQRFSSFF